MVRRTVVRRWICKVEVKAGVPEHESFCRRARSGSSSRCMLSVDWQIMLDIRQGVRAACTLRPFCCGKILEHDSPTRPS